MFKKRCNDSQSYPKAPWRSLSSIRGRRPTKVTSDIVDKPGKSKISTGHHAKMKRNYFLAFQRKVAIEWKRTR